MEARGPPEMVLNVWHEVYRVLLLNVQHLLLVLEEVWEEGVPESYPICLPKVGSV